MPMPEGAILFTSKQAESVLRKIRKIFNGKLPTKKGIESFKPEEHNVSQEDLLLSAYTYARIEIGKYDQIEEIIKEAEFIEEHKPEVKESNGETVIWPVCTMGAHGDRTPGVFKTFEEANKIVLGNYGDIFEVGYYPVVVIEPIGYGLYSAPLLGHYWYIWDEKRNAYRPIKMPSAFENTLGFSIG